MNKAPKPFQSKLIPFFDTMHEMRKRRKTWQEIVDELAKHGIKTSTGGVYSFYVRHKKRPVPIGFIDDYIASRIANAPEKCGGSRQKQSSIKGPVVLEEGDLDFQNPASVYFNPKPKTE